MNTIMKTNLAVAVGIVFVLAAGCGPSRPKSSPGKDVKSAAAPPVSALTAVEIRDRVDSGTNKLTLVHFWATWCPPCVHEFPDIVNLQHKFHRDGLNVLLVSMDRVEDRGSVDDFLAEHGVDWQTYIAADVTAGFLEEISPKWSGVIPTSFFFGPDGKLKDWWEGARPFADHQKMVEDLLDTEQSMGRGDRK